MIGESLTASVSVGRRLPSTSVEAQAAGLSWPLPDTYDEGTLERLLFPSVSAQAPAPHLVPDWSTVHRELKRKGVTLFLLWQE